MLGVPCSTKGPMQVIPVTPAIGAEVVDCDVASMSEADFTDLQVAWRRHKVLFIRDQRLDMPALVAFSGRFGELMRLPYIRPLPDHPDVIGVIKAADEVGMGVFGGDWHSDFSFLPAPPAASLLYSVEIPPLGGDTLWANLSLAWESMDPDDRALLRDAVAIHTGKPYGVSHAPSAADQFRGSIGIERNNVEADRETRHPAVRLHPDTGEEALFVNPTYTTRIEGLEPSTSDALMERVYRHCTRPEFCCRWRWRPGVLAIWDNRSTMHYAVNDYDGYRREMYRTTTRGETPLAASAG